MLKQFKQKKGTGRGANFKNKKKEQKPTIQDKKEEIKQDSDSEVSDVSDSEDSEYEELLISGIVNKTKIEDVKKEKKPEVKPEVKPDVKKEEEELPPPLPLERQQTNPIDIKPKKKSKSKKIIIKKYYQKREPKTTPTPAPQLAPEPVKLNYLGLPITGNYNNTTTTRNHITNRIFNW